VHRTGGNFGGSSGDEGKIAAKDAPTREAPLTSTFLKPTFAATTCAGTSGSQTQIPTNDGSHRSQQPNDENDPEAASQQQEGRACSADEPPTWSLYVIQPHPLLNRRRFCLIEITRQAELFAVGFRNGVDCAAIAACK